MQKIGYSKSQVVQCLPHKRNNWSQASEHTQQQRLRCGRDSSDLCTWEAETAGSLATGPNNLVGVVYTNESMSPKHKVMAHKEWHWLP